MGVEVRKSKISLAKGVVVRPSPLQRHSTSMNQAQQIIVLPSNLLLNSRGGQETILRLAKSLPSCNGGKIVLPPKHHVSTVRSVSALKRSAPNVQERAVAEVSARKRANLDHMSSEEKMMRRKLKNRVAAQNARDKKRMKMDQMEERLTALENENKKIIRENANLIALNKRLLNENQMLQRGGSLPLSPPSSESPVSPPPSQHDQTLVEQRSFESAEPINVSLRKEQDLCSAGGQRVPNLRSGVFWTCLLTMMAQAAFCQAATSTAAPAALLATMEKAILLSPKKRIFLPPDARSSYLPT